MHFRNLLDPKHSKRYKCILKKEFFSHFSTCRYESIPIFVFGLQRSGTTMMMNVFEENRSIKVYNEQRQTKLYKDFMIRDFNNLKNSIDDCRFPYVTYKTICDSHKIEEFLDSFINCKAIWMYRNYRDVSNSYERKFSNADRAIRIICTGGSGGGWMQEGVSEEAQQILKDVYHPQLSCCECLCLVWWARNRIVLEKQLHERPNVLLIDYDRLVQDPHQFKRIYQFIGLEFEGQDIHDVHALSIGKDDFPEINQDVRQLCESLTLALEQAFLDNSAN